MTPNNSITLPITIFHQKMTLIRQALPFLHMTCPTVIRPASNQKAKNFQSFQNQAQIPLFILLNMIIIINP